MMAGALAAALVSWGYDGTVAVMVIGLPMCALGSVILLWRERYLGTTIRSLRSRRLAAQDTDPAM